MAEDKPATPDDDEPVVKFRSSSEMGGRIAEWMAKDKGRSFMQGAQEYYEAQGGGFAQFARTSAAPPPKSKHIKTDQQPEPEPEPEPKAKDIGEISHRPLRATSDVDADVVDAEIVED